MIEPEDLLNSVVSDHPRQLVFATVSGAHLYGFPSRDSDFDIRGVHLMRRDELFGLAAPSQTVTHCEVRDGREIDMVTHDAKKFFQLMLKRNGYVLEQLLSPLVIHTSVEHEELIDLGKACITRHHIHHYVGFARNQWDLFMKEERPMIKPLLYVYRVLLTGIYLMRTGRVEANLVSLNKTYHLPHLPDLIAKKIEGCEHEPLSDADVSFHETEYSRLQCELKEAGRMSTLPNQPSAREGLNDLLLRLRRKTCSA